VEEVNHDKVNVQIPPLVLARNAEQLFLRLVA
jgi:hypothetical protein